MMRFAYSTKTQRAVKMAVHTFALFQIGYVFFLRSVHNAAAITKYVLLHVVCIQFGHNTLS